MLDFHHARVRQATASKTAAAQTLLDACLEQIGAAMQALPPEAAETLAAIAFPRRKVAAAPCTCA